MLTSLLFLSCVADCDQRRSADTEGQERLSDYEGVSPLGEGRPRCSNLWETDPGIKYQIYYRKLADTLKDRFTIS